jgi:hypothetical protein
MKGCTKLITCGRSSEGIKCSKAWHCGTHLIGKIGLVRRKQGTSEIRH